MFYSKAHFAVRHAASKEATRFNLNGVHFRADGVTEATDGFMAMRVKADTPMAAENFPTEALEIPDHPEPLTPFTLPNESVDRALRAIPAKPRIQELACLALDVPETNVNGSARFVATDIDSVAVVNGNKVEAEFPKTDQIFAPARDNGERKFRVDLRLMERVIKAAKEVARASGKNSKSPVWADFYVQPAPEGEISLAPIRIVSGSEAEGAELEAIVMPARIK